MIKYVNPSQFSEATKTALREVLYISGSTWLGKNIAAIGSSNIANWDHFQTLFCDPLGATGYKLGVGGTLMSHHPDADYDEFSGIKAITALISVYADAGTDPTYANDAAFAGMETADTNKAGIFTEVIAVYRQVKALLHSGNLHALIISWGANDFARERLIGVSTPVSPYDEYTLKGAQNSIIEMLNTTFPQLNIVFNCPSYRFYALNGEPKGVDANIYLHPVTGLLLHAYSDAIIEIAKMQGCPVWDGWADAGFNKNNKSTYFVDDGHFNDLGYQKMSSSFIRFIASKF